MVRKASTRKRQTEVAGKKKLVAGVDFAPPEPIASVLPRIQLTNSQEEELWALVCKGRRCNPNIDDDAAMAKEIFETVDLTNAVQQALQFYVRDEAYRVELPTVRNELKALRKDFDRFLARLPQEHESVVIFSSGRIRAWSFWPITCVRPMSNWRKGRKPGRRSMGLMR